MGYDRLNFHPLVNTATTGVSRADLLAFLEDVQHTPQILAIGAQAGDENVDSTAQR